MGGDVNKMGLAEAHKLDQYGNSQQNLERSPPLRLQRIGMMPLDCCPVSGMEEVLVMYQLMQMYVQSKLHKKDPDDNTKATQFNN